MNCLLQEKDNFVSIINPIDVPNDWNLSQRISTSVRNASGLAISCMLCCGFASILTSH